MRSVDDLDELHRRLTVRLRRFYPEWNDLNAVEQRKQTESQLQELVRLNTSYLECSLFRSDDPRRLNWRNLTQRDFFAALWMTIGASNQERTWFHDRIDVARDARDTSIAEVWRMICGMPDEPFSLQLNPSNRLWLDLIRPLYRRPDDACHNLGRPTETDVPWMGQLVAKSRISDHCILDRRRADVGDRRSSRLFPPRKGQ